MQFDSRKYETDISMAILVKKADSQWVIAFGVSLDFRTVTNIDKVPAAVRILKSINTNSIVMVFSTAKGRFTVGAFTIDTLANTLIVCDICSFFFASAYLFRFVLRLPQTMEVSPISEMDWTPQQRHLLIVPVEAVA